MVASMDSMMTKREIAKTILKEQFANRERVAIAELVQIADGRGVSRRTLTRAAQELGIREVHNGPFGAFWERPYP